MSEVDKTNDDHCADVGKMVADLKSNGDGCTCGARGPCECGGCRNVVWVEYISEDAADLLARTEARRVEFEIALAAKTEECERLREERDSARAEVEMVQSLLDEYKAMLVEAIETGNKLADQRDEGQTC